jgi:hypothetical protein
MHEAADVFQVAPGDEETNLPGCHATDAHYMVSLLSYSDPYSSPKISSIVLAVKIFSAHPSMILKSAA